MSDFKFYMIYLEGKSSPTYKHQTIESALAEAKRLCEMHNCKAYILGSVSSVEIDKFKVTPLCDHDLPF